MERPRRRLQFSLYAMFVLMTLLGAFCHWLTLPSVVVPWLAELWETKNRPALNLLVPDNESCTRTLPESSVPIALKLLLKERYMADTREPVADIPAPSPVP